MLTDNFAYRGLMEYFMEISAIPRASYKEQRIADYLCEFARTRGLEYYRDSTNNVLINLPATKGCESRPACLLQGHTDMVCEKNADVEHDFDTTGIKLCEKDGWICAEGTTLGADNGVAVAVMLYVLDGGLERHGDIQCLFTASEEVGLDGAKAFDYSRIYARRMINMDSADENYIIAGCAGGQRTSLRMLNKPSSLNDATVAKISITGLMGGHSGEDIQRGRANANVLMGRLLASIFNEKGREKDTILQSVHGGNRDNAIPRECEATVGTKDYEKLEKTVADMERVLRVGMCADDAGFNIKIEKISECSTVLGMNIKSARNLIFMLAFVRNGIFEMNHSVPGLVEWSRNLGIVHAESTGTEMIFSARSSFEERIDLSETELDVCAAMFDDAIATHYNRYPGWSFSEHSELRDAYSQACEEVCGKKPTVCAIHAGLECGFIKQALPDMDIISCGPNILDLHSPDERMNKMSFERFFTVIKKVLEG